MPISALPVKLIQNSIKINHSHSGNTIISQVRKHFRAGNKTKYLRDIVPVETGSKNSSRNDYYLQSSNRIIAPKGVKRNQSLSPLDVSPSGIRLESRRRSRPHSHTTTPTTTTTTTAFPVVIVVVV